MATVTTDQSSQKVDLDINIQHLGKIAIDSHLIVIELNSEFASLIDSMEAESAGQLNEIIEALRVIAADYRHLEHETRSLVKQTNSTLEEVIRAACSKDLPASAKIKIMRQDFTSLSNQFDGLARRHAGIAVQLDTQANKAQIAKEKNDRQVKKAEKLKDHAQVYGIMGVPGVGLALSVSACAVNAAESVDNPLLKALAGFGGAIGGVAVGAMVTVGSPILLIAAAVLAVKSRIWSVKFGNMHDKIRKIQEIMDMADQYLSDIVGDLNTLNNQTNQVNEKQSNDELNHAFGRIERSCKKVRESCTKYTQLADKNTKNIRQITASKSK